jgi:hypothetical protein
MLILKYIIKQNEKMYLCGFKYATVLESPSLHFWDCPRKLSSVWSYFDRIGKVLNFHASYILLADYINI